MPRKEREKENKGKLERGAISWERAEEGEKKGGMEWNGKKKERDELRKGKI